MVVVAVKSLGGFRSAVRKSSDKMCKLSVGTVWWCLDCDEGESGPFSLALVNFTVKLISVVGPERGVVSSFTKRNSEFSRRKVKQRHCEGPTIHCTDKHPGMTICSPTVFLGRSSIEYTNLED